MTDNEIIKGLEHCRNEKECIGCPLEIFADDNGCIKKALALINRQKAEIERLEETPKCVYAYDGETMEYCVEGPCPNFKTAAEIRAEAVKEFAERLNAEMDNLSRMDYHCEPYFLVSKSFIDNLVKEMVGADK